MTTRRPLAAPWVLLLIVGLTACASIPSEFEQVPSATWQHPEQTRLGQFFAEYAPDDPELSGVFLLDDPRDAFRARFTSAGLAEKTLDMQYYLWKGDLAGRLLLYRALQAADRGVRVRLLIDDIYHAGRDEVYAALDVHPEMEIRVFNPMGSRGLGRMPNLVYHKGTLDHRMHNKIWLVDAAVAVLGGRNIGDDYFGVDPELNFHDLDVLAVGPAAREAGTAFDAYWNSHAAVPIDALLDDPVGIDDLTALRRELEASLDELEVLPYTVALDFDAMRDRLARLADELTWSNAEVIVDSLERFQGGSVSAFVQLGDEIAASAERDIVIVTAYLIPADDGIARLAEVTGRGVRVRILTNSMQSNNHGTVHAHYMKYRDDLIDAGAELYELRADSELIEHFDEVDDRIADSHAGLHAKAFVVDERLTMIGSYNMDPRSRIWNSEIGLLIDSEEFAASVLKVMETNLDPVNSYRVTLDEDGDLVWTAGGPDGTQTWDRDPGSSAWQRLMLRFMSWVPMENEL